MASSVEDLDNHIVDRINVPPRFLGRIDIRLDSIEIDAIGPEITAAEERDDSGRTCTGVEESVA
jgi:hypothetical protein